MVIDSYWSVEEGKYAKGRHFENEQLFKFTFSYQLPLAKFSVCLVSENHRLLSSSMNMLAPSIWTTLA